MPVETAFQNKTETSFDTYTEGLEKYLEIHKEAGDHKASATHTGFAMNNYHILKIAFQPRISTLTKRFH